MESVMNWRRAGARTMGWLTTLSYRLNRRVTIGPGLLGNGRLRIVGPGRVTLAGQVNAWSHAEVNRLVTTNSDAVINVGRNTRLNGCTIVAAERVDVGADCVLGSCEIRDHLPFPRSAAQHPQADLAAPVMIEENVWIGGQVSVLPGVRIGRDSVIGMHAVVFSDIPRGVIAGGNPARVLRPLEDPDRRG
ncbi:MAG: acyltransferase [Chloroflexi bacterium]|nr:MAG: acyltransferase [Chloroflexota bacterium]TME45130.1 MAG: acyltransferase [Chloroflexota bacterium]